MQQHSDQRKLRPSRFDSLKSKIKKYFSIDLTQDVQKKHIFVILYYAGISLLCVLVFVYKFVGFVISGEFNDFIKDVSTGEFIPFSVLRFILIGVLILGISVYALSRLLFSILFTFYSKQGIVVKTIDGFLEKGLLSSIKLYEDRPRNGVFKEYYEDGGMKYEMPYKDGKLHGTAKGYFSGGGISFEVGTRGDSVHGIARQYTKGGQVIKEAHYRNDQLHGNTVEYSLDSGESGRAGINPAIAKTEEKNVKENVSIEDGALKRVKAYRDGRCVNIKIYDKDDNLLLDQDVNE